MDTALQDGDFAVCGGREFRFLWRGLRKLCSRHGFA